MTSFVGTNPNQVPTNSDLGRFAFLDYIGWDDTGAAIPVIAAASAITPVLKITRISGTGIINTIIPPIDFINGGQLVLIPTGRFSFDTTGNIAVAMTADVSKPLTLTYDAVVKKWYPSYSNTINNLVVNSSLSNNVSVSIGNSVTITGNDTLTLSNVKIVTNSGNFTCDIANHTLVVGKQITITGTNTGDSTVATGTYYIIATNGTTTFQLSSIFDSTAITTIAGVLGTTTGLTFTCAPVINVGRGGNVVYDNNTSKVTILQASTSAELASVITDYTGTAGKLVFSNSPVINGATINGDLIVNGSTTFNSSSFSLDDKNLRLGAVNIVSGITGTISSTSITTTVVSMSSVVGLVPGMTVGRVSGTGQFGGSPYIVSIDSTSQITITSTTANTTGTLVFDSGSASDATANGGGIILKSVSDKTLLWDSTNANWTSSENLNIASTKLYKINNVAVLSSTSVLSDASQTAIIIGANATTSVTIGSATSGTTKVNYNLEVMQNIYARQNVTAYFSSDKRLKENIVPIQNPLDKILQLSGNTFKWTAEHYATQDQTMVKENDVGVIAQEVQSVLPEAVHERDNGTLAVDYQKIVPLLIECIKAQQLQINELLARGNT